MISPLIATIIFLHNPESWKADVYDTKYNQAVTESRQLSGNISWYGTGTKGLYTACWNEFPKGTRFRVTFAGKSVVVVCDDRGSFKQMGRVLDLSGQAFEQLAPLRSGIIRGAKVEVL